jgi:hypothetical protein
LNCEPRTYSRAFSSEVGTGSREENASNKKIARDSESIQTESALIAKPVSTFLDHALDKLCTGQHDVARRLTVPAGHLVTQAPRGIWVPFQDTLKQAARNPDR